MIGQTLNKRYRIVALLGEGAMGEVYRATDTQTRSDVAIKVITAKLASSTDMLERFRREGEALRQLRHANIVAFVDMFPLGRQFVIVMEYVAGGSLHSLIKSGPLPIDRAVRITLELSDALARAHHLNIIHRDIKPENVLLTKDGAPKLTDFGVARLVSDKARLTGTGTQIGTPYYMCPEAWEGRPLDQQADIWSLGVMLFETLTGQVPFNGDTLVTVMHRVLTAPLPEFESLRPEVPPALGEVVRRMLTRDLAERYRTMRQVAVDLEEIEEAVRRGQEEARRMQEEARRKQAEEQQAKALQAQKETQHKAEEAEQRAKALQAQEEARRKQAEEQRAKVLQAQAEARRKTEEEQRARARLAQEAPKAPGRPEDIRQTTLEVPEQQVESQPARMRTAGPRRAQVLGGVAALAIVGLLIVGGLGVWAVRGKVSAAAIQATATQSAEAATPAPLPTNTLLSAGTPRPSATILPLPATSTPTPGASNTPLPLPTLPPTLGPSNTPLPPTQTLGIGSTQISPVDGMKLLYVPAGNFLMGSVDALVARATETCWGNSCLHDHSNETPQHTVYLDAFWIDQTEVTNALYVKCVASGQCKPAGCQTSSNFDQHPVVCIPWTSAQAYCAWAGRRLPTEAEWEKAARGTDGRVSPWGGQSSNDPGGPRDAYNVAYHQTVAVGQYPKGASPYDALDMLGDVWEWVNDWYDPNYYRASPASNPPGPASGKTKVIKGGSWYANPSYPRVAGRNDRDPASANTLLLGFRCASSP